MIYHTHHNQHHSLKCVPPLIHFVELIQLNRPVFKASFYHFQFKYVKEYSWSAIVYILLLSLTRKLDNFILFIQELIETCFKNLNKIKRIYPIQHPLKYSNYPSVLIRMNMVNVFSYFVNNMALTSKWHLWMSKMNFF